MGNRRELCRVKTYEEGMEEWKDIEKRIVERKDR